MAAAVSHLGISVWIEQTLNTELTQASRRRLPIKVDHVKEYIHCLDLKVCSYQASHQGTTACCKVHPYLSIYSIR